MENRLSIDASLIATCGMNCGICIAHLREKKRCEGCNSISGNKAAHCLKCSIKECEMLKESTSKFCYECNKFPCARIKQLDKRYRTNYKMSMIENLENIKNLGIDTFVKNEIDRWSCKSCGGLICVHRGYCLNCEEKRQK